MSVTAAQIATYLSDLEEARAEYMDDLVLRERLGHKDLYPRRVIASVLNCYISIANKYFSQPVYVGGVFQTTYNFFDEVEMEEIMLRINKICDTNYYLDLI